MAEAISRVPDLVQDSSLQTEFRDSRTIHSYREIDETGHRYYKEEHWEWDRYLGRGGFGEVRLQKCVTKGAKRDSLRAVKIIAKPSYPYESLDLNRELEAIAKFSNDRYKRWFVKSFGWFENRSSIFVTMEYCYHGDLEHYLRGKRSAAAGEVQQLVYQILEGIHQMHQNDFAHRDLKPGNILIKSMPPEKKWWIVLSDFGISKRADESNGPTTAIKGTAEYMAPELLGYLDQVNLKSIADYKAADVWALGEIIFQILTGEHTFQNPRELMGYCNGQQQFPSTRLPVCTTDDGREFISRIMMATPQDRMTTTQCIQHRWMKSMCVDERLAALHLEESIPLMPEISLNESASARWSSPSTLEQDTPMQTIAIAQWKPESSVDSNPVQVLPRHQGAITSIAFSPNGRLLATGTADSMVRIWTPKDGKILHARDCRSKEVLSLAFSPNSKLLTAASGSRTIQVWDCGSGRLIRKLTGYTGTVSSIAFSPDGRWIASGSSDGKVRLWDFMSEKRVKKLEGHITDVLCVAISPDGKLLSSGSLDGITLLWNASSGELIHTLGDEGKPLGGGARMIVHFVSPSSVGIVAFSPDSKQLVVVLNGGVVQIWDARSGKLVSLCIGGSEPGNSAIAMSSDAKQLVVGSKDRTVQLLDIRSHTILRAFAGHEKFATCAAFSPDGKRLASGSRDQTVRIWDI